MIVEFIKWLPFLFLRKQHRPPPYPLPLSMQLLKFCYRFHPKHTICGFANLPLMCKGFIHRTTVNLASNISLRVTEKWCDLICCTDSFTERIVTIFNICRHKNNESLLQEVSFFECLKIRKCVREKRSEFSPQIYTKVTYNLLYRTTPNSALQIKPNSVLVHKALVVKRFCFVTPILKLDLLGDHPVANVWPRKGVYEEEPSPHIWESFTIENGWYIMQLK